ncbi:MAG TPA: energy transducer TonB, partial [Pyrinomonadaceae bacterium]|nr:energy transducer TonB [Pyrinomonadaceae bacterium]
EARQAGVRGTVVLRGILAADGTVQNLLVIKGLPGGLSWQAVEAARQIRFTPAMIDGKPVSMFVQMEYCFDLY